MNIFIHELKSYRKSTVIWTLALIGIATMYIFVYPAFSKDLTSVNKLLESYPDVMRKAIGFTVDTFTSLTGYYALVISFILLCGAIQAMNLGLSLLSRETADKTADFLLTKPVKRVTIVASKLLAALTLLVITNLIYIVVATMLAKAVTPDAFSMKLFLMISLTIFLVQLMFLSLGLVISVLVKKIRSVISVSLSTVFSFFVLSMFGQALGEETVRYLTPFKYFEPGYIIKNTAYETKFLVIEALFVIAAIGTSFYVYSKKDIHAV